MSTNTQSAPRQPWLIFAKAILCTFFAIDLGFGLNALAAEKGSTFHLVEGTTVASFLVEDCTDKAVLRAANDVRTDIEHVTDKKPALIAAPPADYTESIVIVGVVGHSEVIDRLARDGKLDICDLKNTWESFTLSVVPAPFPGVEKALVIVGSDRRGAIYGLYELSSMIGVSPWHWWADIPAAKQSELLIEPGTHRFGPPSIKYRGVFINDEDWGLLAWASKTFEPEIGNIGPKTYGKIFELLLRLKGNTVWPAMHPTTRAFNYYPCNKEVADEYGIVMGSSHAEPMLRNNVDEWKASHEQYNYVSNRDGVRQYWAQRLSENGRYENIYTLGMRGIHDSHMIGPKNDAERIKTLRQIFDDQRELLALYINPKVVNVPQIFCAYKEVLELYRQGLKVPDDVTIVWPDDNFGFIRNFSSAVERKRTGGAGVYYHLSYLGAPLSYLWLSTTPPALIWEEMSKAYESGADRLWIANVGDIKPAEIPLEFFLQMAWDVHRWNPKNLSSFLRSQMERDLGSEYSDEAAALLNEYYILNFQRKPEHLQWWIEPEKYCYSTLTDEEVTARLDAFSKLHAKACVLREKMPASRKDAYYQLVYYPITGSWLANVRYFEGERGNADIARDADRRLIEETRFFNEQLSGGKWRGIMTLEPADTQWRSMRIARWNPPDAPRRPISTPNPATYIARDASNFANNIAQPHARWTIIPGLGRTGSAITVLPTTFASIECADARAKSPRVEYPIDFPQAGIFKLELYLLPTHPIRGDSLRIAVGIDDNPPQMISLAVEDGQSAWAQGVLNAVRLATAPVYAKKAGKQTLRIYAIDPGVVLDKIVVDLGGLTATYLGPASQQR